VGHPMTPGRLQLHKLQQWAKSRRMRTWAPDHWRKTKNLLLWQWQRLCSQSVRTLAASFPLGADLGTRGKPGPKRTRVVVAGPPTMVSETLRNLSLRTLGAFQRQNCRSARCRALPSAALSRSRGAMTPMVRKGRPPTQPLRPPPVHEQPRLLGSQRQEVLRVVPWVGTRSDRASRRQFLVAAPSLHERLLQPVTPSWACSG